MSSRLSIFFLFAVSVLAGFCAGVNFPSERPCMSPDLRWTIRCLSSGKQADGGYLHTLFSSRFPAANAAAIFASGRSCDVLWCDDSRHLAITDWSGSSESEIYFVEVSPLSKATPLMVNNVAEIIHKDELEGHCYYEALRWEDPHQILIRIFGHTDENPSHGFAYYLSIDTASGSAKLVKKEGKEPDLMSERK